MLGSAYFSKYPGIIRIQFMLFYKGIRMPYQHYAPKNNFVHFEV
jgi:hypothetical protein